MLFFFFFTSFTGEVKALKPSVHMRTSAVDTSLSGPEEVDIFPASRFLFFTHILLMMEDTQTRDMFNHSSGFLLLGKFRTLGRCPTCKPQEPLVSQIYTVTSFLELEQ